MLLPVGPDNFRKIIENKTVEIVDKTLFIKEILDDSATEVAVITRPRRFGKTLALSMLHHFLASEIGGSKTAGLFDNLKITECGDDYMQHQGKYPVIFVTFKSIKDGNFSEAYESLSKLMSRVYSQHKSLLQSQHLDENQKQVFQSILSEAATRASIKSSLLDLTYYLHLHTQQKPWVLIDEYDTPIQAAYINNLEPEQTKGLVLTEEDETRINYYRNMTNLMRSLLGDALKSNPYLHRAVITGILRIAKESLFSDLNNLEVYSLLDNEYSQHFGFTEAEVEAILIQADLTDKADEIRQWYNGYQMGETRVYNPWSIASCIKKRGEVNPYWINTGENQLIKELLKKSSIPVKEQLETIFTQGRSSYEIIDENVVFGYLDSNTTALWTLFLMSGYLTPVSTKRTDEGTECELAIPNKEIGNLYRQIIKKWLASGHDIKWYNKFINALLKGDMIIFEEGLQDIIEQIASYHDLSRRPENFYHGLFLGLIASLHNKGYKIKSNRESGLGRYDILVIPEDATQLSIRIEFKNSKDDKEDLQQLAEKALKQIESKNYAAELKQHKIKQVLVVAIAFRGKAFILRSKTNSVPA